LGADCERVNAPRAYWCPRKSGYGQRQQGLTRYSAAWADKLNEQHRMIKKHRNSPFSIMALYLPMIAIAAIVSYRQSVSPQII
jgi:hypothetical protein